MRWSYKTIHYELKKEGLLGSAFLDESEIELSLNQYGKAGWELVSLLETMDGLIAVFKQPLDLDTSRHVPPAIPVARKKEVSERVAKKPEKRVVEEDFDLVLADDDEVEAVLLDDFEVVEDDIDQKSKGEGEPAREDVKKDIVPPADVGSIKIE